MYEKTICNVVVNSDIVGSYQTTKRASLGCPLRLTVSNVDLADLEEEMRNEPEGRLVLGRLKF